MTLPTNSNRRLVYVAAAIVVGAVLVSAAIILPPATHQTKTAPPSTSTTVSQPSVSTNASSTTADATGLRLSLTISNDVIAEGDSISINITDFNTLPVSNSPQPISILRLGTSACPTSLPLGVGIFQGDFDAGNVSSAQPMDLYHPGVYSCGGVPSGGLIFSFAPSSDNMNVSSLQAITATHTVTANSTTSVQYFVSTPVYTEQAAANLQYSGYWTDVNGDIWGSNATLHSFGPGEYTIEAVDLWGHEMFAHFQVIPNPASSATTTTLTVAAPGQCPAGNVCASFSYNSDGQIRVDSVNATQQVCFNCGVVNGNGHSYVYIQVTFENTGSLPIYIPDGSAGVSTSPSSNSSVLQQVVSGQCAGTYSILKLDPGKSVTLSGPSCEEGFAYQVVNPGTVTLTLSFNWTTNSQASTNPTDFQEKTTILAQLTF